MRESFPSFYILSLPSSAKWSWSQPNECKHGDSEFPDTALEWGKSTMLHGKNLFPFTLPNCQLRNCRDDWPSAMCPCRVFQLLTSLYSFMQIKNESVCNVIGLFSIWHVSNWWLTTLLPFFIARTQACASNKCDNTACRTWLSLQEHISLLQRSFHTTWLWSSASPSDAKSCIWCVAQVWAHLEL